MSIEVGKGSSKRDWVKLISAVSEAAFKSLTLGKDGFSATISPLFRALEALRGQDNLERKAMRLIIESISYAITKTIVTAKFARPPTQGEIQSIVEYLLGRVQTLSEQNEVYLTASHIEYPGTFALFDDVVTQIFHQLKSSSVRSKEVEVVALCQLAIAEGLGRIRTRSPEYYSHVFEVLSGVNARLDAKTKAWTDYRKLLVQRFEDEPLFGEDVHSGVRLGQVYQELRAYWEDEALDSNDSLSANLHHKTRVMSMLDSLINEWLDNDDEADQVRLISGGPGSGKSTYAKKLASVLATQPEYKIIFVPLQRLKGNGPLEGRIDEYFRLQVDDPFENDTTPLADFGRNVHVKWMIIFDGLDELAKEGSNSESAAQDFASSLADWRGRIGGRRVRFLVLGRAPSMQEARRRLGLHGKGTLHVCGMAPRSETDRSSHESINYIDPGNLKDIDQRPDFWARWAIAKGLPVKPPEAISANELLDLTNEPLLAYLLILSGYVSDRWREAANNRNRIYKAIFDQIWERERAKTTRIHLNDIGKDGFEALLQSLGIAAWRGGGRTGDELTFVNVRNILMRPDLLERAKLSETANLSNVALLFYTRKDEEGGKGYEFLHKSFGEYLTARGLFEVFIRWGNQAVDPVSDFSKLEFLRRWLHLAGAVQMTQEVLTFLRNEARLWGDIQNAERPWIPLRKLARIAEQLMDLAVTEGLPAQELSISWRQAERQERNSEEALLGILDAVARAAYTEELYGFPEDEGGWKPGPIHVPSFNKDRKFVEFIKRLSVSEGWLAYIDVFIPFMDTLVHAMISRLSLVDSEVFGLVVAHSDMFGTDFERASLGGSVFLHTRLSCSNFRDADLDYARFVNVNLMDADLSGARLDEAAIDDNTTKTASFSTASIKRLKKNLKKKRMLLPLSRDE